MATATSTRVLTTSLRGSWVRDLALVVAGAAFIAVSAQVSIPLPFSPVPVTGQTFAVLLTGAALGASLGVAATGLYLAAALAGLPVLAPTETGGHLTGSAVLTMPTLGYVVGFMAASAVVGTLAARGFTRSPLRTVAAMLLGNVFWVLAYDTEYAMVDRADDLKIGIKTSAITFGRYDVAAVMACYAIMLGIMAHVGRQLNFGLCYHLSLGVAALIMGYHYTLIRHRERMACFKAFLHNNWVGAVIFGGIVAEYATRTVMGIRVQ